MTHVKVWEQYERERLSDEQIPYFYFTRRRTTNLTLSLPFGLFEGVSRLIFYIMQFFIRMWTWRKCFAVAHMRRRSLVTLVANVSTNRAERVRKYAWQMLKNVLSPDHPICVFNWFPVLGAPKVLESIVAALQVLPGLRGFPERCWKRVSRAHSSGSRRSNGDVRGIAIQYRYLRSFHRARNTYLRRTCSALSSLDVRYTTSFLVPRLCSLARREIPVFPFSLGMLRYATRRVSLIYCIVQKRLSTVPI